MKTKHHGQMSESFLTAVFLSLSGGLQDAYTYLFRGKVFANAQTGNIVLLSANIMDGRWDKVLHYLVPLCAFALGVLAAEKMREHFQAMQRLHWRQLVVLGEVLLLFAVGFLPQSQNLLANAIVSFSCAMQVQAFRKVNGYAFASTMCIGDLRSGVEAFCIWRKSHEPHAKDRMVRYFGIILLFALGAGLGSKSAAQLGGRAIWLSCCFLLVSFALMFIREELEENPVIEKDLTAIRQETREIDRTLKQELQEEQRELKQSLKKEEKRGCCTSLVQQPFAVLVLFVRCTPCTGFGQQLLELAGGSVQRAVMVVDKADGAGGDDLLQVQLHQLPACQQGRCHRLRHKGQSQLAFDQREHLVGGGGFGVRFQHRVVLQKELPVKAAGHALFVQTDQGITGQLFQAQSLAGQRRKGPAAHKNFVKGHQLHHFQPVFHLCGGGYDGKIYLAVAHCLHRLRGGVVGDAQPDARILGMEGAQLFGQVDVQSGLGGADADGTVLQRGAGAQLFFCILDLYRRRCNAGVQQLPLRR